MRSKIKHALIEGKYPSIYVSTKTNMYLVLRTTRLYTAGITYDSLEVRDYDSQDEEDGLEPGQILVAMTRGDKIDLDQYIGICEKVVVSTDPP